MVQSFHQPQPENPKLRGLVFRSRLEEPEPQYLTLRELAVLELLSRGDYYREIAETLDISINTVSSHIHRIYEKLQVRSRAHAAAKYTMLPQTRDHRSVGQVEREINCK